jgi:DNA-binding NarL/FixJ family response regulator
MAQKLLIIDDEPEFLELLYRIISEKTDLHITRTSFPHEVPDLIKENIFDLVISDVHMPGYDGLNILKLFAEDRPEKIILISSVHDDTLQEKSIKMGASYYLEKPFKKNDIIEAIKKVMK